MNAESIRKKTQAEAERYLRATVRTFCRGDVDAVCVGLLSQDLAKAIEILRRLEADHEPACRAFLAEFNGLKGGGA